MPGPIAKPCRESLYTQTHKPCQHECTTSTCAPCKYTPILCQTPCQAPRARARRRARRRASPGAPRAPACRAWAAQAYPTKNPVGPPARLLAVGQVGARLRVHHAHLRARHGQPHRAAHVLARPQPPARQHRRRLRQAPAVLRANRCAMNSAQGRPAPASSCQAEPKLHDGSIPTRQAQPENTGMQWLAADIDEPCRCQQVTAGAQIASVHARLLKVAPGALQGTRCRCPCTAGGAKTAEPSAHRHR